MDNRLMKTEKRNIKECVECPFRSYDYESGCSCNVIDAPNGIEEDRGFIHPDCPLRVKRITITLEKQ